MSMIVRMDDNCPHRYWVSSEEDRTKEYCVDICDFPLGLDESGVMLFNGNCFMTRTEEGYEYRGCKDFIYRCLPRLKRPEFMGKVFRCKHCRASEDHALKILKPYLLRANPNPIDEKPC